MSKEDVELQNYLENKKANSKGPWGWDTKFVLFMGPGMGYMTTFLGGWYMALNNVITPPFSITQVAGTLIAGTAVGAVATGIAYVRKAAKQKRQWIRDFYAQRSSADQMRQMIKESEKGLPASDLTVAASKEKKGEGQLPPTSEEGIGSGPTGPTRPSPPTPTPPSYSLG